MTVSDRFPHDIVAVESRRGRMSRRRLLGAGLGAAAGLFAVDRAVATLPNGRIITAAGPLEANNLAPAERIPPPKTTTAIPDGHLHMIDCLLLACLLAEHNILTRRII